MDQAVRIIREFSPFLAAFGALRAIHLHQSLEVANSKEGAKCGRPTL